MATQVLTASEQQIAARIAIEAIAESAVDNALMEFYAADFDAEALRRDVQAALTKHLSNARERSVATQAWGDRDHCASGRY